MKAPSEHVRGDALGLAIALLTSQGKARKVTDKSYNRRRLEGRNGAGRGDAAGDPERELSSSDLRADTCW